MIVLVGDIHGRYELPKIDFFLKRFPELNFTKSDYFIILGDFGIPWNKRDYDTIGLFKKYPFTTLFIDGNHENFDLLESFPIIHKFGGKVNQLSKTLFRLRRGEVYKIDNKKIFTFGGAYSVDKHMRKLNVSWWEAEEFNNVERANAITNLDLVDNEVDYVLTHCMPKDIKMVFGFYQASKTEEFLYYLANQIKFKKWYSGHYHIDQKFENYRCLYDDIVILGD